MKAWETGRGARYLAIRTSALCLAVSAALLSTKSLAADAPNYTELFKTKALKCLHPTVDPNKSTVELLKGPEQKGETTTVRVKVYYPGLLKKDSMEADLMIRQSGSIRQMRVTVLADSSAAHKGCDLEKNWQDF